VIAGNLLPQAAVSALSISIYGMFLAIIVPPSRNDSVILGCVLISFILSWLSDRLMLFSSMSEGTRILILTLLIASAAALFFPRKEESDAQ